MPEAAITPGREGVLANLCFRGQLSTKSFTPDIAPTSAGDPSGTVEYFDGHGALTPLVTLLVWAATPELVPAS